MDQRPTRPGPRAAVRGAHPDENTAPAQVKQTLHKQSKSIGNMSGTLVGAGIKAPAKRAFGGDISNTTKAASIYDESALALKQAHEIVKPVVQQDKAGALLRPVQRSSNNVASKLSSNLESEAPVIPLATKPILPLKHTQSKKATTIYKDADVEVSSIAETLPAPQQSQVEAQQGESDLHQKEGNYLNTQPDSSDCALGGADPAYEDAPERQLVDLAEYQPYIPGQSTVDYYHGDYQDQRPHAVGPQLSSPNLSQYDDDPANEEEHDGYTTAHSFRSRGGETTGVTTVLAPKVTANVKKEIAAAKQFVESGRTMEEIEDEAWDTSMVAEYGDEIFAYMRELESKMLPNANYMDTQTEIQWSMRSVLMDWLIQVHHRFALLPETLFLCVNYIDRFLSCKIVSLGKLQLVGATAIFVAAKYEEINCPSVSEIVYMVDGGYTAEEILKAERFMLSMLSFELGWPGPMSFLRRISKADDYDLETRTLAKYFLEVSIMDERFVGCPPSYVAAGAHCFARLMLKKGDWSQAHVYYSGYTWTQLKPLVSMLMECCEFPMKHHVAVYEKYTDRRYKRASIFVQNELAKGFRLPVMPARQSLLYDERRTYPGKN